MHQERENRDGEPRRDTGPLIAAFFIHPANVPEQITGVRTSTLEQALAEAKPWSERERTRGRFSVNGRRTQFVH